jgi:hypothetical protein
LILLAKPEIPAIHVWQADENLVYQRAGRREKDFASSIKNGDDPSNFGESTIPLRGRREGRTWMF